LEEGMEALWEMMESMKMDIKLSFSSLEDKLQMTQASIDGMA
jgi:hypothetical protein